MTKGVEANEKNLRSFGLGLACILGFFAWLSFRKDGAAYLYLLNASGFSLLTALAAPALFHPIFAVWMRLAGLIALANTYLVTSIVFYLFLTPYALVSRLTGSDPLDERLGTGDSYWREREEPKNIRSYERQF